MQKTMRTERHCVYCQAYVRQLVGPSMLLLCLVHDTSHSGETPYTLFSLPPGQNPQLAKCRGPAPSANVATKQAGCSLMADLQLHLCGERGWADQQHEAQELFQGYRSKMATESSQYASATT